MFYISHYSDKFILSFLYLLFLSRLFSHCNVVGPIENIKNFITIQLKIDKNRPSLIPNNCNTFDKCFYFELTNYR